MAFKINLAKSAGFCFGVKRAIDIALNTAGRAKNVYMLGDIVHNEDVVRDIRKSGIKKITSLSHGKNRILLIPAHGAGANVLKRAARLGYSIIDATCPMVKGIHKIARQMEKKGYKLIVIGDKKHDEVHGIIGQLKQAALVISGLKDIRSRKTVKIKKACLVVQSTQNLDQANEIIKALKTRIRELVVFNTICRPTRLRQEEIKKMPLENKVMVIIGSKNSANTKRLYEISKSLNKNSYWVARKGEIKKCWFEDAQKVGITAGASTPDYVTQEVIAHIKKIASS